MFGPRSSKTRRKKCPQLTERVTVCYRRHLRRVMAAVVCIVIFLCVFRAGYHQTHSGEEYRNSLRPQCGLWGPATLSTEEASAPSIAMVTASNAGSVGSGKRSFKGVLATTLPGKLRYAEAHHYDFVDGSSLIDPTRPPSWSKIKAVLSVLDSHDWVFWHDADTVVMNSKFELQSLLPPRGTGPDIIFTIDEGGYNAGAWIVRNSKWGKDFLENWWDMGDEWALPMGQTKSGDNDALKYTMKHMDRNEHDAHVGVLPQRCFNSYLFRGWAKWKTWRLNVVALFTDWGYFGRSVVKYYHRGDFMVHAAGIDDKAAAIASLVQYDG